MALRSERALQEVQDKAHSTPTPADGGRVLDYLGAVATPCVESMKDQLEADRIARARADRENRLIY